MSKLKERSTAKKNNKNASPSTNVASISYPSSFKINDETNLKEILKRKEKELGRMKEILVRKDNLIMNLELINKTNTDINEEKYKIRGNNEKFAADLLKMNEKFENQSKEWEKILTEKEVTNDKLLLFNVNLLKF